MKIELKVLSGIFLLCIAASCSRKTFVVAPPFTEVKKIIKIKAGQTNDEVNQLLGIDAYDVLHLSDGQSVCYYNYRLKDRKININNSSDFQDLATKTSDESLASEKAQNFGTPFYSEWKKLYVTFKEGKVTDFISSTGAEDSRYLLLLNGTIKLLSTKQLDYSHFSKPITNIGTNTISATDGKSIGNSGCCDLKDRDIVDGILFPLQKDGGFVQSKKTSKKLINFFK